MAAESVTLPDATMPGGMAGFLPVRSPEGSDMLPLMTRNAPNARSNNKNAR